MGGNALKNCLTVRLDRSQYIDLEKDVLNKLKQKFSNVRTLPYYFEKESFGDMDLIVEKPKPSNKELEEFLFTNFNTKEVYFNSDVVSFEYNQFQIDLIFTSKDNIETSIFYFSYNDLNNICGKVYKQFDLKFGHKGLYFPLRGIYGTEVSEILISKDCRKIYQFGGFDYDRYLLGFNNLEKIFEFCCSSKYFNYEKFQLENIGHQDRTRNRKRKTYMQFLTWLETSNYKNLRYQFSEDKTVYYKMIDEFFPEANFLKQLNDFKTQQEEYRKMKEKLNGDIIMKLIPQLKGKELGNFIYKLENSFGSKENLYSFVFQNNQDNIDKYILDFYNNL